MEKALVIAVHPDDETLGCAGTLLKLVRDSIEVSWLVITEAKPGMEWSLNFIEDRKQEIKQVKEKYSFSEVIELGFPTTRLDSEPLGHIIKSISDNIQRIKPNIVFLPNHSDVHSDHKIGFEAGWGACKNFRAPFITKIYEYECLSETEFAAPLSGYAFTPNTFIDISDYMEEKLEIMKIYKSEIKRRPFPRSPEILTALAAFRGSRIGVMYAEAFNLLYSSNI